MHESISEQRLDELLTAYCHRSAQTAFEAAPARKRVPIKTIALSAAALVLAVTVGLFVLFRLNFHTNSDAVPKTLYAFSAEKLAMMCKGDADNDSIADKTAQRWVGAWQPSIDYADNEKVVFSVATGVFVLDYHSGEFFTTFDLDKFGVPGFGQGDNLSSLVVSKDGKHALLWSLITSDAPEYSVTEEYRELDLVTGEAKRLNSEDEFYRKYEVFQTFPAVHASDCEELPGWMFSDNAAVVENNDYVIAVDFQSGAGNLGSLQLIIMDSKTGEIQAMVRAFKSVM